MVERIRLGTPASTRPRHLTAAERAVGSGNYFLQPATGVEFFSSGCTLLDLALGGGWAEQRVANIVGDRSTGKTLLAMEGAANFATGHPRGHIFYREREVAWDEAYARALGIPTARLDLVDESEAFDTVEDFFEDVQRLCAADSGPRARDKLYILDSLDALSDRAELARDIDKGTFGAAKAKQLSEFFRRMIRPMHQARMTLMVISQVRENIGVKFGERHTRSGGRALDFYASQRVDLAQLMAGKMEKEYLGVKRVVGVKIRARVKKNKVGLPFREAEFPIRFGYGIDDAKACIDFLNGSTGKLGESNAVIGCMKEDAFLRMVAAGTGDWKRAMDNLRAAVRRRWYAVETKFLPPRRKYGNSETDGGAEDDAAASGGDPQVGGGPGGADDQHPGEARTIHWRRGQPRRHGS